MTIVNFKNCTDCQDSKILEVAAVAIPLQRGDIPYSFSMEQIEGAYGSAAHILDHLGPLLIRSNDPSQTYEGARFSQAASYFQTLTRTLLRSDEISETMRSLVESNELAIGIVIERVLGRFKASSHPPEVRLYAKRFSV